ncbi:MAG: energy-coupling factor transporter ATPase [Ruminococcaceae bacterium]|nr:energy-coupling factor transporter ATPase [Oscillospiraceae bacterium]
MLLRVENLSYTYMKGTPFEKKALDDVSLEIEKGDFVGIIGHTGCGKSTLVQHFNGLLKPDSGNIYINDQCVNNSNIKVLRKSVGFVFQYPEHQLFEATVYKDIAFGLKGEKLTKAEERQRVIKAATAVGLDLSLLDNSIYDLSGGQKRRVAVAGVIVMNPDILVLDEPAAGLDPIGRDEILNFIKNLRDEYGITIILVSHSMDDVAKYTNKVIVMNDGKIEMIGAPGKVFTNAARLREIGLDVPQITTLFAKLSEKFPEYNINREVFTLEDAKAALLKLIGGEGK